MVQVYWVRQMFNIQDQQFNQSIKVALTKVAKQMFEYNESTFPNESPVNQLSSNYYIVNINDVIDANVLEHYLKTEFESRQLLLDFEYAVYDCSSDNMLYGSYISAEDWQSQPEQAKELPKWNEFTYYFGIRFPDKSTFLLNKMGIWIFFTAVLLLFVLFYAYALFVILRQRRLSEFQKDFIDNMTHEFKTPISTINISADVLSRPKIKDEPERMMHYVSIIKKEIARLNNQVEKVLQMSKVEKKEFKLKKEEINLNSLLNEVVNNISQRLANEEVKLIYEKNNQDIIISADRTHLNNAIYNLIDNAIKYSKEENKKLSVRLVEAKSTAILYIKDNGIGIEKTLQKRIFDKFFRVPTQNIHNVKGYGLGLHYVKNVIDAHGWDLVLESEQGKGSTFCIKMRIR